MNRQVGDKLRETPLIPVRERNPESDAIIVRVADPANTQRAIDRLKTLGGADQYSIVRRADGAIEIKFTEKHFKQLQIDAVNSSREAVQRRVDTDGLTEPSVTKQGETRVLVEVPGLDAKGVTSLVELLTKTGVLTFNMVDTQANVADYTVGVPRNNRVALPNEGQGGAPQVILLDSVSNRRRPVPGARPRPSTGMAAAASPSRLPAWAGTAASARRPTADVRQPVRRRARQPHHFRAGHQFADHGRQRPDHQDFAQEERQPTRRACCVRASLAGQAAGR